VLVESTAASRFSFCPRCELYVCAACWVIAQDRCRDCAVPGASDLARAGVTLRATIGPAPSAPPVQSATMPAPARAPARPGVRRGRWRTARRIAIDTGVRLVVATVLAVLVTASIWAVELSLRADPAPPAAQIGAQQADATPAASSDADATPVAPPASPAPAIYVVRPGDTLRSIAGRMLGDEVRWTEIVAADGGPIDDPNNLAIGSELRLPGS
jgi:nucleoid-associated protein YgaU